MKLGHLPLAYSSRGDIKDFVVAVTLTTAEEIGLIDRFRHLQGLDETGRNLFHSHRLHAILTIADDRYDRYSANQLGKHFDEFAARSEDNRRPKDRPVKA